MSPVEQWRAIEALVSERWTEEAISNALVLPLRTLQKLRLLARIHPPMLDRMHAGDMPGERDLRVIASASLEEQAAAWKKHKPKKGESVTWWQLAQRAGPPAHARRGRPVRRGVRRRLRRRIRRGSVRASRRGQPRHHERGRLPRRPARLDRGNLPENGVVLQTEQYGGPKLPPKAQRFYGKPARGDERRLLRQRTHGHGGNGAVHPAGAGAKTPARARRRAADARPVLPDKPRPDADAERRAHDRRHAHRRAARGAARRADRRRPAARAAGAGAWLATTSR